MYEREDEGRRVIKEDVTEVRKGGITSKGERVSHPKKMRAYRIVIERDKKEKQKEEE